MQVGLGQVPGIPGLGEQAEIRQPQFPDQPLFCRNLFLEGPGRQQRVDNQQHAQNKQVKTYQDQIEIRLSHFSCPSSLIRYLLFETVQYSLF